MDLARFAFAFVVLSGCGRVATPRQTAASCVAEGTWDVSWTPTPAIAESKWGFGRTATLVVAPDTVEDVDGNSDADVVQVDRTRCRIHAVSSSRVNFSDDAGERHERLVLDLTIDGERARVTGRYRVWDSSETPTIDVDATVSGTATRATRSTDGP